MHAAKTPGLLQYDLERMHEIGHRTIDALIEAAARGDEEPILRKVTAAEMRRRLEAPPPEHATAYEQVLERVFADVVPFPPRRGRPCGDLLFLDRSHSTARTGEISMKVSAPRVRFGRAPAGRRPVSTARPTKDRADSLLGHGSGRRGPLRPHRAQLRVVVPPRRTQERGRSMEV